MNKKNQVVLRKKHMLWIKIKDHPKKDCWCTDKFPPWPTMTREAMTQVTLSSHWKSKEIAKKYETWLPQKNKTTSLLYCLLKKSQKTILCRILLPLCIWLDHGTQQNQYTWGSIYNSVYIYNYIYIYIWTLRIHIKYVHVKCVDVSYYIYI